MTAHDKLEALKTRLSRVDRLAIAFSGGVDSSFLLKIAVDVLGRDRVLAVTARAVNFPAREDREAEDFAKTVGARQIHLAFEPLSVKCIVENRPERCYFCKKELLKLIWDAARRNGIVVLADGGNADDADDHRPGMKAVRELNVWSPLEETGIGKSDIRLIAREMNLPFRDKPSFACLASRIQYGQEITAESLEKVGRAEQYFLDLGLKNIRVRLHGNLARIEVNPDERARLFDAGTMDRAYNEMRRLGFDHAALDLRGYKSGGMNETTQALKK